MFGAWNLRWADVDPARNSYDASTLHPDVHEAIRQFGLWVAGSRWTQQDGGPLGAESVAGWREYLERLAELFREIDEPDPARAIEMGAARLLPFVVERTATEDAWYRSFSTAVAWFAEYRGFDDEESRIAIFELIDGEFHSWSAPGEGTAKRVCKTLGERVVAPKPPKQHPVDALVAWQRSRGTYFEYLTKTPSHPVLRADDHVRYIDEVDRARDPGRAERMHAALVLCRDSATRGMPLTVDQLAEWQGVVLGLSKPAPLRTTDAFAKSGRERYGFQPTLGSRLDANFAEASGNDPATLIRRAAIAYLDVCFFHPFDDGCARAARLALDHVLWSSGYALQYADPIFRISRLADDYSGNYHFAAVLDLLAGPLENGR